MTAIPITKPIDYVLLNQELAAVAPEGAIGRDGFLYKATAAYPYEELPPEAVPVVDAHVAPPQVVEYARSIAVSTVARTTNDVPLEVFRFPCDPKHRYRANMSISGIDAGNFVSREMEGRFVWKRAGAGAVMVGITIVSNLGEAASSTWAPNALPQGNDVVFTVKGAAGRTIDWILDGHIDIFAPEGLDA